MTCLDESARLGVAGLIMGLLSTVAIRAQLPTSNPSFEVASIKQNKSDSRRVDISFQGSRFTATNVSLSTLIRVAYGEPRALPPNRLLISETWIGAPNRSYLDSDRFDVVAKAEGVPSQDQVNLMLRTLLAERFKLVLHHETKALPIYSLVMARTDGRLGSRLRPSTVDCSAFRRDAPTPPPAGSDQAPPRCQLRTVPGKLTGQATMSVLATSLSDAVEDHRPVQDRTGLAGTFDFDLEWTPDQVRQPPPDAPPLPPIDPNGTSIFTAIREQLGLKLESQKDQIDILVVDSAARPTED